MTNSEAEMSARILIVDDEPMNLELMEAMLTLAGYEVSVAGSGEEGQASALRSKPDLILLDLMMPARSGLEILADLGERIPDSLVIVVTAHPSSDNAIAALRLGAFDFIVKGFKNEVMLKTVARAVELQRSVVRNRQNIRQLEAKIQDLLSLVREYAQESDASVRPHPQA